MRFRRWTMVSVCGIMLATPAVAAGQDSVEATALRAAAELRASTLDASSSDEPLRAWLLALLPDSTTVELETNDCGEQAGDPRIDTLPALPLCVSFVAEIGPSCTVGISVLVGTWSEGPVGRPELRSAYVTWGHETQFFGSLELVAAFVRSVEDTLTVANCT